LRSSPPIPSRCRPDHLQRISGYCPNGTYADATRHETVRRQGASLGAMKIVHLLGALLLASCGGDVAASLGTGNGQSAPSGEAGTSAADSGVPSGNGSSVAGGGTPGGPATSVDASCELPPLTPHHGGGQCTFCGGQWYCPEPRTPAPQCPPGATYMGSCSDSCIMCNAPPSYGSGGPFADTAWSLGCVNGVYLNVVSSGATCAQ